MISILCPTRQRPDGLKKMIGSAFAMAQMRPEIVCYVDNDDDSYDSIIFPEALEPLVRFVRGPRITLSNMWNKCAAVAHGDIFMQGNDDIVFRTNGWDAMVEAEFSLWPDRLVAIHGSDGSGGASGDKGLFAVHPFVHRRWYETLGYVTAPYFSSDWGDTWINDLANGISRRIFMPFLIEHLHYWFGKSPMDANTQDRMNRHNADNVDKLYRELAVLRQIDIDKLRAAMLKT